MYLIKSSSGFKKDFKAIGKDNRFKLQEFEFVLGALVKGSFLDEKYQDHKLHGEFSDCRECHIQPDVLLIYKIDKSKKIIYLLRIGSHSKLF